MTRSTELLGAARQRAATRRSRYRAAGFWSSQPLDVVAETAAAHPDRLAATDRNGELTFAELDQRVDAAASTMIDAGVRTSDPVVLVVGNDIDSLVAVHAALRIDAVVLLVPRSAGAAQVADIVRRTQAPFGAAPNWAPAQSVELSEMLRWVDLQQATETSRAGLLRPARAADEPSFVLFTSGTTSAPKGVAHSLSTLSKASSNYIAAAGLTAEDRIFLISPLASVTGVLQAVFISPMLAIPVVLEDRWDPVATCELLLESGATWYGGPDRLLDRLLDEARKTTDQAERGRLYNEVQKIVHDDAPWAFIANWKQNAVARAEVQNFSLEPSFLLILKDVSKG